MQQTEEVAATENVLAFIPCDTTGVVLWRAQKKGSGRDCVCIPLRAAVTLPNLNLQREGSVIRCSLSTLLVVVLFFIKRG